MLLEFQAQHDPDKLDVTLAEVSRLRIEVRHGEIAPNRLFAAQFLDTLAAPSAIAEWLEAHAGSAAGHDHDHAHHAGTTHTEAMRALSLVSEKPLAWPAFEAWLRKIRLELGEDLLRCKGILNIAGQARPIVVQGGPKYPRIGAFRRVNLVSGFHARCLHRRYGRSVSAPKNHFSWETETDLTRDWFETTSAI